MLTIYHAPAPAPSKLEVGGAGWSVGGAGCVVLGRDTSGATRARAKASEIFDWLLSDGGVFKHRLQVQGLQLYLPGGS